MTAWHVSAAEQRGCAARASERARQREVATRAFAVWLAREAFACHMVAFCVAACICACNSSTSACRVRKPGRQVTQATQISQGLTRDACLPGEARLPAANPPAAAVAQRGAIPPATQSSLLGHALRHFNVAESMIVHLPRDARGRSPQWRTTSCFISFSTSKLWHPQRTGQLRGMGNGTSPRKTGSAD